MKFHHILRTRRALRVAALGVALALAPSAAWSQFGTGVPVSPVGKTADQAEVAITAAGAARVAYRLLKNVYLALKDKVGPTTRKLISAPNADASNPAIAGTPAGDLVVAYLEICRRGECVRGRDVSPENVAGQFWNLSAGSDPDVAISISKYSFYGWRAPAAPSSRRAPGDHRIQARSVSPSGVLGPIKNISPADGEAYAPRVVVDADGDALFVWLHDDGDFLRVQARSLPASGVRGPIQDISPAGADADHPQVAMTSTGDAVIVWQLFNATFSESVIQTRTRSAAGVLGSVVSLSSPGTYAVEPQVALDAAGDALFIWELRALPNSRVQARHLAAAGTLEPIQNITAATGFAYDAQVARSADGDAVIIWTRNNAGGTISVQARTRADAGPLGPVQTLSTAPFGTANPNPQVAMNDAGDAVAVWGKFDGANDRLWVAFGP